MPSALQEWVQELSIMQQTVLVSAIRNEDGVGKDHPQKELLKWYRRCVLLSAFDKRALTSPYEEGGGNFTGPVADLDVAATRFIRSRDSMSLHYYGHAMHAFQIVGYKHPDPCTRQFWNRLYERMVHALHLFPETEEQMDSRLGDSKDGWEARMDKDGGCTS